jgi:hypothetical protein
LHFPVEVFLSRGLLVYRGELSLEHRCDREAPLHSNSISKPDLKIRIEVFRIEGPLHVEKGNLVVCLKEFEIMLENHHCKCHICKVELHLFKSLTEQPASVRFSALALSSPALARFSDVSELLTDLHTRRNADSGASLAGELAPVLICARRDASDFELIQAILVPSRTSSTARPDQGQARLQTTRSTQGHHNTSGVQSSPTYPQRGGLQETPRNESMFKRRVPGCREGIV